MKNKEYILELRNRIDVGITTAIKLLEQTKYNVPEAESLWQLDQIDRLAKRISVNPKEATELLQFVKYDYSKALSLFMERNTTDIEKIIESSNKPEQVLGNFWVYISYYLCLDDKFGGLLNEKGFQKLPDLIREIVLVWQWYAYYDFEGVSVEQVITNDFIKILENKLELNDLAHDLKKLKEIIDKFNCDKPSSTAYFEEGTDLHNKLTSSEEYVRIDNKIEEFEERVMKKTYEYLVSNLERINEQLNILKKTIES
ncbi:MAG: hypothetical protein ACPGSD_04895 [Flavobacteriales bacterium]